jgi:nucleoredoxin
LFHMSAVAPLFQGAALLRPTDDTATVTPDGAFKDTKYVALYFSAHWCGPCRNFTPILAKMYDSLKASRSGEVEVVFVSADQDKDDFTGYRKEMPWLALDPFDNAELSDTLRRTFEVEGFPTVVVLDSASGKVVNKDAVQDVAGDRSGAQFPWPARTLADVLTDDIPLIGSGTASKATSIGDLRKKGVRHVALYFSAHWCGPCRNFTPTLAKVYKAMAGSRQDFEFIFVSGDRDAHTFAEYHATMGFAAMPFNHAAAGPLKKVLGVQGIPTLVTLDLVPGGGVQIINAKARGRVWRTNRRGSSSRGRSARRRRWWLSTARRRSSTA